MTVSAVSIRADELITVLPTREGYLAQTIGDAEVSASGSKADAISHGGTVVGATWDDDGYNIAAAGPGEGHGYSGKCPGSTSSVQPALESAKDEAREVEAAVAGAIGGAGVGAATAGTCAACCCGCVIL